MLCAAQMNVCRRGIPSNCCPFRLALPCHALLHSAQLAPPRPALPRPAQPGLHRLSYIRVLNSTNTTTNIFGSNFQY